MAQFTHTCPNCSAERAAFRLVWIQDDNTTLTAICGVCDVPSLFWVEPERGHVGPLIFPHNGRMNENWTVVAVAPELSVPAAPGNTPDNIASLYIQGVRARKAGMLDAAVPMFRRALEATLKKIDPDQKPRTSLYDRIEQLPSEKAVTPAMKEWAHAVRLLGAAGAHEEEAVSEQDVDDIQAFTEIFLTYAFTLPARIAAMRARQQAGST